MNWICSWHRRQLARCLILRKPLRASSALSRHLERCSACSEVLSDYVRIQGTLESHVSTPTLSHDFNARLRIRLQRERDASAASAARSGSGRIPLQLDSALALAVTVIAAVALLYLPSGK